jgi:hypothetical protein
VNAADTLVAGVHLELKMDGNFPSNPFTTLPGLSGFADFLGFDSATTEAYWRAGLTYVKYRFGIDATTATFDPVVGMTYLTVASNGSSVQTSTFEPGVTNLVITPVSTTGEGTYRVVQSTAFVIQTHPNCRPLVKDAEFILTFTGDIILSGTYGAEVSSTGTTPEVSGNAIVFGRYAIRGIDGYNYFFDVRSYIPNRQWPTDGSHTIVSERVQINPLNRTLFVGPGLGTINVVAGQGPLGTQYRAYVRTDWWLGPVVSFPALVEWDSIPGNTSAIPPGSSVTGKCP